MPAGTQPWGPRRPIPRLLPGASVACEVVSLGANIQEWVFWGPLGHKTASWLENSRKASWSKDPRAGAAIPPPTTKAAWESPKDHSPPPQSAYSHRPLSLAGAPHSASWRFQVTLFTSALHRSRGF